MRESLCIWFLDFLDCRCVDVPLHRWSWCTDSNIWRSTLRTKLASSCRNTWNWFYGACLYILNTAREITLVHILCLGVNIWLEVLIHNRIFFRGGVIKMSFFFSFFYQFVSLQYMYQQKSTPENPYNHCIRIKQINNKTFL